jgi:uncharacterized protein (TIGR02145 family)
MHNIQNRKLPTKKQMKLLKPYIFIIHAIITITLPSFSVCKERLKVMDLVAQRVVDKDLAERKVIALKTESVPTVTSATGRIWMDRNLGASQVATSKDDSAAFGALYQWGRGTDGHEKRTSSTTSTNSSSDIPGHGNFIVATYNWREQQNNRLWQGVNGTNNPCPVGFRLPTKKEWESERSSWSSHYSAGAFTSPLKLIAAGYRYPNNGTVYNSGSLGFYWCSTVDGSNACHLYFSNGYIRMDNVDRAYGLSIRCIKD